MQEQIENDLRAVQQSTQQELSLAEKRLDAEGTEGDDSEDSTLVERNQTLATRAQDMNDGNKKVVAQISTGTSKSVRLEKKQLNAQMPRVRA
jgi:hypothetical protein